MSSGPFLSVVLPAYNEERRLPATLARVLEYLAASPYTHEVVLVDDGSRDSTPQFIAGACAAHASVRGIYLTPNQGKGAAVKAGMLAAQGEYLLFSDSDLSTPIEEVEPLLARLQSQKAGVAIGSRRLPESNLIIRQPFHRRVMGAGFNLLVQALALPGLHDTQCGFKLFTRAAARDIFPRLTIDRFGFDVEALYLARRFGHRIVEVPVTWRDAADSKVSPLRDSARMFGDLLRIRLNDLTGRYNGQEVEWPKKA
ncbi:MAG: dolichyl-phosphate beta-glucosyltransferase [Chitinophagales bacterium]